MSEEKEELTEMYGSFMHEGYDIRAYYGKRNMIVVAFKEGEGEVDRETCPPYTYEPRYGLDVEDATEMEAATDRLLGRLK